MRGEPHSCVRGVVESLRAVRLTEGNRRHALRTMPSHRYSEPDCLTVSMRRYFGSRLPCSSRSRQLSSRRGGAADSNGLHWFFEGGNMTKQCLTVALTG